MKKRLLTAAISTVCVLGITATAFAVPVEFIAEDWFAWGRVYNLDGTTANNNPYDGNAGQPLTLNSYTGADGTEDAWGVTEVIKIRNPTNISQIFWQQNVGNNELTVFFNNGDDVALYTAGPVSFNLLTTDFTAKFYLDTKDDFNPSQGTAGRTGDDVYLTASGAGEGELVLELAAHIQYLDFNGLNNGSEVQPYALSSIGDITTGAFLGNILLDVVGGSWASLYDTNQVPGGFSYYDADFVLSSSTNDLFTTADWLVQGNATARVL